MDVQPNTRRIAGWWAALPGVAAVLVGCSASSPAAIPTTGASPATTAATVDSETGAQADRAEVQALWESVLTALETGPDERPASLAALGPAVTVTLSERTNTELPLEPSELTSNASYDQPEPDRITIADCVASNRSSVLGLATVGLRASATRSGGNAPWVLSELETVVNCVPRQQADAALAAFNAFEPHYQRMWAALDPEDPAMADVTDNARASLVESFTTYQKEGFRVVENITRRTVEVAGTALDGAIVVSVCTNFGPGSGTFYPDGSPVPDFDYAEFIQAQVRMVPDGTGWLFDGFSWLSDTCLFAPTDQQAALL